MDARLIESRGDEGEPLLRQSPWLPEFAPFSRNDMEGLRRVANWKELYASVYQGHPYQPFLLTDKCHPIEADPPHERDPVAL